jgi:hypothetical protein
MPRVKDFDGVQSGSKKISKTKRDQNEKEPKKVTNRRQRKTDEDEDFMSENLSTSESQKSKFTKRSSAGQKHIPQLNTLFVKYLLLREIYAEKFFNFDFAHLKDHNINQLLSKYKEKYGSQRNTMRNIFIEYIEANLIRRGDKGKDICSITKLDDFYSCYKVKDGDNIDVCEAKYFLTSELKQFMNSKYYTVFICDIYRGVIQSRLWLIRNKYPIYLKFFSEKTMSFYTVDIPNDLKAEEFLKEVREEIVKKYDDTQNFDGNFENFVNSDGESTSFE